MKSYISYTVSLLVCGLSTPELCVKQSNSGEAMELLGPGVPGADRGRLLVSFAALTSGHF